MSGEPLDFTGERFTPECVREIWYEHWHRYAFAAPLVAGRRVLDAANHRYEIEGDAVTVSASVGITVFPDDGVEPELLIRHADQAMYIAKQTGRIDTSFSTR